jgi:hypothetical protein
MMALIRCTQKLLLEMGIESKSILHSSPKMNISEIEEWYANLFIFERQKCIVFINASTLFISVVFYKKKREIQNIQDVLLDSLSDTLEAEEVESEVIARLRQKLEPIALGKTNDRQVVGCLNEVIRHLKFYATNRETHEQEIDWVTIVQRLNRMPWVKARFTFAIDGMEALMRDSLQWDGHFSREPPCR